MEYVNCRRSGSSVAPILAAIIPTVSRLRAAFQLARLSSVRLVDERKGRVSDRTYCAGGQHLAAKFLPATTISRTMGLENSCRWLLGIVLPDICSSFTARFRGNRVFPTFVSYTAVKLFVRAAAFHYEIAAASAALLSMPR